MDTMTAAVASETRALVLALHALLTDIDPARWRARMEQALEERLKEIEVQLRALLAQPRWDGNGALETLKLRLQEMQRLLLAQVDGLGVLSAEQLHDRWMGWRGKVVPAYEALAASVRQVAAVHVPSLRPTNYKRNLMHVSSAVGVLGIIALVMQPWLSVLSGLSAVWAWSMEFGRRRSPWLNSALMRFFGPVAHPHEAHRVNSATWYMTALFLLSLTGSAALCAVSVAVLGLGDPSAALIGRRWGKIKLVNGRSLEGSLAFVVMGGGGAALCAWAWGVPGGAGVIAAVALAASVGGALAELLSRRVDDNFSIPVAAMVSGWLCLWALGVTP
jgi:dolichol kinase